MPNTVIYFVHHQPNNQRKGYFSGHRKRKTISGKGKQSKIARHAEKYGLPGMSASPDTVIEGRVMDPN